MNSVFRAGILALVFLCTSHGVSAAEGSSANCDRLGFESVRASFSAESSSKEARRLAREGLKLLAEKNYEAALAKFHDAQVELPESAELHYNIGTCLYRLERYDEANRSFEAARLGGDRKISKRALFQLGNSAVKEGKLEAALEHYEQALKLDPNYDDVRVNREWVIRKIEELAAKKKEQQEKQEEQQRYIEKLQALIQKQAVAHLGLRAELVRKGSPPFPTRVAMLKELLDAPLADGVIETDVAAGIDAEAEDRLWTELDRAQRELRVELAALIEEGRQRSARESQRAAGQGQDASGEEIMPDPEAAKIALALPHLEGTQPLLERAIELVENRASIDLHGAQEETLVQLFRALNELQGELARLIQDQAALLKRSLATAVRREPSEATEALSPDELRDLGVEEAGVQGDIRQRTLAFTKQIEQHLQQMKQQGGADPNAPRPAPAVGSDPRAQEKRIEKALGHLLGANTAMESAESALKQPDYDVAPAEERKAADELLKARAALTPPSQSGSDGEKKDDKKASDQKGEQKKPEEDKKGEPEKDKKSGEDSEEPKDDREEKGPPPSTDSGDQGDEKGEEKEPEQALSKEQAKKMLERARQEERDRRKKEREKARRVPSRGGRPVKDW